MKNLNIPFEDKEFKQIEKAKGEITWHDFIIQLVEDKEKQKEGDKSVKR